MVPLQLDAGDDEYNPPPTGRSTGSQLSTARGGRGGATRTTFRVGSNLNEVLSDNVEDREALARGLRKKQRSQESNGSFFSMSQSTSSPPPSYDAPLPPAYGDANLDREEKDDRSARDGRDGRDGGEVRGSGPPPPAHNASASVSASLSGSGSVKVPSRAQRALSTEKMLFGEPDSSQDPATNTAAAARTTPRGPSSPGQKKGSQQGGPTSPFDKKSASAASAASAGGARNDSTQSKPSNGERGVVKRSEKGSEKEGTAAQQQQRGNTKRQHSTVEHTHSSKGVTLGGSLKALKRASNVIVQKTIIVHVEEDEADEIEKLMEEEGLSRDDAVHQFFDDHDEKLFNPKALYLFPGEEYVPPEEDDDDDDEDDDRLFGQVEYHHRTQSEKMAPPPVMEEPEPEPEPEEDFEVRYFTYIAILPIILYAIYFLLLVLKPLQ